MGATPCTHSGLLACPVFFLLLQLHQTVARRSRVVYRFLCSDNGCGAAVLALPIMNTHGVDFTDPTALTEQLEGMLGLTMLPLKLARRIGAKEYVEMYKILPELWHLEVEVRPPAGQMSIKGTNHRY